MNYCKTLVKNVLGNISHHYTDTVEHDVVFTNRTEYSQSKCVKFNFLIFRVITTEQSAIAYFV